MFEATFRALLYVGWQAALAGIAATLLLYFIFPRSREGESKLTFWRYLGGSFVAACVGYGAGAAIGIVVACSTPKGGNLCGLMGIFGLGPLLAGIAMFGYACYLIAAESKAR